MVKVKPIAISIGVLLLVGFIIPVILSIFIDLETPIVADSVASIKTKLDNGYTLFTDTIFELSINPFDSLSSATKTKFSDSLAYMSIIPDWLLVPIVILCIIGIVFGLLA